MNAEGVEVITWEEFTRRFEIGRTTFFKWKKEGRLQAGRDLIQTGRILRVLWGAELLKRLLEASDKPNEKKPKEEAGGKKGKIVPPRKRTTAMNLEY
jgi:hypothetical protein